MWVWLAHILLIVRQGGSRIAVWIDVTMGNGLGKTSDLAYLSQLNCAIFSSQREKRRIEESHVQEPEHPNKRLRTDEGGLNDEWYVDDFQIASNIVSSVKKGVIAICNTATLLLEL